MSFTLHGVGVSGGIAIGRARLVSHAALEVAHYNLTKAQVKKEIARFNRALTATRGELETLKGGLSSNAPAEFGAFLDVHRLILDDPLLSVEPKHVIESQLCNAEWAVKHQMEMLLAQFDKIEDEYLRERKSDVVQVVERLLKELMGRPGQAHIPQSRAENSIVVARDLSPADVILFKTHQLGAFITDVGGANSHTAIVARSLNIPSIVALHHARELIAEDELLIVDGVQGVVIVEPDKQVLAEYKLRRNQWELERAKLKRLRSTPAMTRDGTPVELQANIELPQDVEHVKENGATGIGLFRSEFLFLNRTELPTEDEQFEAYRKVAHRMRGLPVTIRTLDLGADKHLNGAGYNAGANPALGLRAIRLCLAEPQMFRTQLRAILRASHYGCVKILIPMLSSVPELEQTLHMIKLAKQSLKEDAIPFDPAIEVGGMVEIPAAALSVGVFLRRLDFLSIGTNDLIQYTLAIDRADDATAYLYDPLHPAVLQLIAHTIRSANKAEVPVTVCGEMAGDPNLTRLLLGFGLRQFSMHPTFLPEVKQRVINVSLPDLGPDIEKILETDEPAKIRLLLAQINA